MPAGQEDAEKAQQLRTLSTARSKLIGQAIIDGLLAPSEAALVGRLRDSNYDQSDGDYTQRGGDHKQTSGGYNQASSIVNIAEELMDVLREAGEAER